MFSALLLALATTVAAAPVKTPPQGWATGYLEDYQTYHQRYLALSCYTQHNTTFFEDCCRPMLSTENLDDNRKAYCNPSNAQVSSASAYAATASASASADVEAASEYSAVVTSTAAPSSTSAAASAAAVWAEPSSAAESSAAPTSTWVAPTTTSTAAAETSAAAPPPSNDEKTNAYATFFYQNGVAGACGKVHSDNDYIIAIDTNGYYHNTGVVSEYCGRQITLTNTKNGKSVTATVADACPTCDTDNSLDLSYAAFTAIAPESDGQVPITWHWA